MKYPNNSTIQVVMNILSFKNIAIILVEDVVHKIMVEDRQRLNTRQECENESDINESEVEVKTELLEEKQGERRRLRL